MIDITTLAFVVAITVAFCIPFIHSHRKKKKHEKSILNDFMGKAASHRMNISSYDIWRRSYAIGIDEKQAKLLYMKFGPETIAEFVNLENIRRISISKEEREIGTDKEREKITDKLVLALSPAESAPVFLEFYNSDENMGMMGEPVLIQKWHDLVKGSLGQKRQNPRVTQNT